MTELMKQTEAARLISDHMRYSHRHVYDRFFHLPTFPTPVLLPSITGKKPTKRWNKEDVLDWIRVQTGV
jgi:hypothetical protein